MAELEVIAADVTKLEVDAIANAANTRAAARRRRGGGDLARRRAGGPARVRRAARRSALGEAAVETTAGDMPAALGDPRGDDGAGRPDLGRDHRAGDALDARPSPSELGCRSLALVAFGTGVGGFPLDEAARLMVGVAREHEGGLERIVFAVHGDEAERAFRAAVG